MFRTAAAIVLGLGGACWGAEFRAVGVDRASVRAEPRPRARVLWKARFREPLQVLQQEDAWVRVRDFRRKTGWVQGSLLDDLPTAVVAARTANVRKGPGMGFEVAWELDRGYALRVVDMHEDWVKVADQEGPLGWIHVSLLWGRLEKEPELDELLRTNLGVRLPAEARSWEASS